MDQDEVTPSNPFLQQQKENTVLDIALQILSTVTARKAPRKYREFTFAKIALLSTIKKVIPVGTAKRYN